VCVCRIFTDLLVTNHVLLVRTLCLNKCTKFLNYASYKYAVLSVKYFSVSAKFNYGSSILDMLLILIDIYQQLQSQILSPFATPIDNSS